MEKSKNTTFVNGAAILAIAGLLCKIIGALFRIPLRNMMGVQGMTYYSTVYPYYSALLVVSSAGLPTAISKLVAERVSLGDPLGAKRIFRKSLTLLAGIGIVTTALMFFGADFLAKVTNCPGSEPSFRALAPALFLVSIMCAFRGYLQGLQQMEGTAFSQLAEQVGKLVFSLILAKKWLPYGFDVAAKGALLGITISEALGLAVIAFFYWINSRKNPLSFDRSADTVENGIIRSILVIAVPVTIGASIMPLTGIVDTLLIKNIMLSTGFTREYADMCFAVFRTDVSTVINMPAVLTIALAMSLVPAISAACARKDTEGMHRVSSMGMKLALVVGLPCAVGLFVIGGDVIDFLFNVSEEELAIGRVLMQISSIGIIFLSLVQTMTGCIQGLGKPMVPVLNLAAGAITKAILMLVLMPNPALNIKGAAISTVCCYAVAGILDTLYLIRKTGLKIDVSNTIVKPCLSAAIMGVSVFGVIRLLRSFVGGSVATLGSVAVGVVVYFACVFAFGIFTSEEMKLIPGGTKIVGILKKIEKKRG